MALVMLPCELPWWPTVQNNLKKIAATKNTTELIEGMQKIHELCNVSLDPDEEATDPQQFIGFVNFLDNDLTTEERSKFLNTTLPNMVKRASSLKDYKPKNGLHFSLQQQPDCMELDYNFVSSLIANAFFSTFPKRTEKSHPTLQDFNFSNFFKHLTNNAQKQKLRSIIHYFNWLEEADNSKGCIRLLRQVMSSREWLTIEDWLECSLPLCPLFIKNDSKMERNEMDALQMCFSCNKIGRYVLGDGYTQESITLVTIPELLCVLLNVEALEDNEVLTVEKLRQTSRITDAKNKAILERHHKAFQKTVCCVDAEDYTSLPLSQYEEDNILRELNKCLLAFQQKQSRIDGRCAITPNRQTQRLRRLSPIGESMGSNASDSNIPLIAQQSCSTTKSRSNSPKIDPRNLKVQKEYERPKARLVAKEGIFNNRRGRFIVLGSSGECLPVKRKPDSSTSLDSSSESSEEEFHSAKTSLDEDSEEEKEIKYKPELESDERRFTFAQRLREALRRETSNQTTVSEDSSYAVGIIVEGSGLGDHDIKLLDLNESSRSSSSGSNETIEVTLSTAENIEMSNSKAAIQENTVTVSETSLDISLPSDAFENLLKTTLYESCEEYNVIQYRITQRDELIQKYQQFLQPSTSNSSYSISTEEMEYTAPNLHQDSQQLRRGGSRGFMLNEDSLSEASVHQDKQLNIKIRNKQNLSKKDSQKSSENSVTSEYSSELEEVYEQFSKWLQDPILETETGTKRKRELDSRDLAVVQFAGSLLKRALSESFAGVPLTNGCENATEDFGGTRKNKLVLNAKSLSLELARQKHRLAAQLLSELSQPHKNGIKPIVTGNWGCGQTKQGEVQLKVIIQWLAASVAGVPSMVYYTCSHQDLVMLDTVYRLLRDRKWTVKDLAEATLRFSHQLLHDKNVSATLFEELIGVERSTT